MRFSIAPAHALSAASLMLLLAACTGGSERNATGDTAATAATAGTGTRDTAMAGMAGMDHPAMAAMNRSAPRDSNQAFLRMMSDHHAGLIAMADSAEERLQTATAKSDARKLQQKQRHEQQRMLAMLRSQYGDSITPMIMPGNRVMMDSTLKASGAPLDAIFYRQVMNHHREGIAMTEKMVPHLTGEAKQMAQKALADQRREIQEFERKQQTTSRP